MIFTLLLSFLCAPALAGNWLVSIERAGFFGQYSLGVGYEWSPHHEVDLSYGFYSNGSRSGRQLNTVYRFSPWTIERVTHVWVPVHLGLFLMFSLEQDRFFFSSPSKYPYKDYYEQNALRGGVEFGTAFRLRSPALTIAYHMRFLDNGMVAIYNNSRKDLQYYLSSGIALQYRFE